MLHTNKPLQSHFRIHVDYPVVHIRKHVQIEDLKEVFDKYSVDKENGIWTLKHYTLKDYSLELGKS